MIKLSYVELDTMSNGEIGAIVASGEDFVVIADIGVGMHIQKFVNNDKTFRSSKKKILDRIGFIVGGWHGFFAPAFLQIWNLALLNGYKIERMNLQASTYEFCFVLERKQM